jgi:hypothetical protein
LEKKNRELQDLLAARQANRGDAENQVADDENARPAGEAGRGERRGRGFDFRGRGGFEQQANAIRELMAKPEVQALVSAQQKAAIEARYAALFKNLNLPPEQEAKLKSLLAERTTTMMDVASAARDQGINPRENPEAFRKLVTDAQNEINNSIKSVIGDSGFTQLQTYEQTMPQRNLVNELQQRLAHSGNNLSMVQEEQLVQILAANAPQRTTGNTGTNATATPQPVTRELGPPPFGGRGADLAFVMGGPGGGGPGPIMFGVDGGGRGGNNATVTPAAVAQAQTVLSQPQLTALQQIQQQQQTQQQLQQLVRDTLAANQPTANAPTNSGTNGANASGTTSGAAPARKRPGGG